MALSATYSLEQLQTSTLPELQPVHLRTKLRDAMTWATQKMTRSDGSMGALTGAGPGQGVEGWRVIVAPCCPLRACSASLHCSGEGASQGQDQDPGGHCGAAAKEPVKGWVQLS